MARTLEFKRLMTLIFSEEPRFSSDRRDFLKTAALGSAAALATTALPGCGSFDRWVLGDPNRLNSEVMILGAGLAGLSAAYQLKKNKMHFRVYEASSRIGGRVQSLKYFNQDQQVAEMGGEFFEASHKYMHQLCKDLNVPAVDVSYDPTKDQGVFWIQNKVLTEKEFRKQLRPLAQKIVQTRRDSFASIPTELTPRGLVSYPKAAELDQKSLADLLNETRSAVKPEILDCFERICVSEWGVESKEINLLQFLVRLDMEERNSLSGPNKIYRVEGGVSRLVDTLGERIQGIVPNSTLRLEHQLVAIRNQSNGFECTFKTAKGSDTIWARQVICTLPWSTLKDVAGIQSLTIPGKSKELIGEALYATHSKVVSSFKDAAWKKKGAAAPNFQGVFRGDLQGQSYWDSSRGQGGTRALMTSQRGGQLGKDTNLESSRETLKDLRKFYKDLSEAENVQVTNWSQKPFSKGSRLNLGPGKYLKFLSHLSNDEFTDEKSAGFFYMAGEHLSFKDFGSMNGAVETAMVAADLAMEQTFMKPTGALRSGRLPDPGRS